MNRLVKRYAARVRSVSPTFSDFAKKVGSIMFSQPVEVKEFFIFCYPLIFTLGNPNGS